MFQDLLLFRFHYQSLFLWLCRLDLLFLLYQYLGLILLKFLSKYLVLCPC